MTENNTEKSSVRAISDYFPPIREPQIVLTWLTRLRWLAIIGQLVATAVALGLGLKPPISPLLVVVAVTAVTNIGLWRWVRSQPLRTWMVLAVLLLDMTLLTVLLICTGGPRNPFCFLYLVHVAMAVAMLGAAWVWIVVGAAAVFFGLIFLVNPIPLGTAENPMSQNAQHAGMWTSLVLVGGLIAYFSGRVMRELQRRDAQLHELKDIADQHDRLATLTALSAGAAHELGTPLATIAVSARELELAIERMPGFDDMVEDAKLIRQECNRCRFILDRMRVDVVDDTREVVTPVDELLNAFEQHLSDSDRARLILKANPMTESIAASSPAMEQALVVLIRNAADASPPEKMVRMSVKRMKDMIGFEVTDEGHGMPPDVLKRAGNPFFTTKDPGRGMGLGLFLVRLVADRYKGKFTITSKPGEGTRCLLEIPVIK